tara:strand:- start:105 stop:776 length:672 start_codon:yes stop_codon:yes gene_type:complete
MGAVRFRMSFDAGWYKMINDMEASIRGTQKYKQEIVNLLAEGLLKIVKEITPADSGELRDAWKIFTKTLNRIVIGNETPDALERMVKGVRARTITVKNGKSMHFFIGGQEFFRQKVDIKGTLPDDFLQVLLEKAVDQAIADLLLALLPKYIPILKGNMIPKPRDIKRLNLSKTVGLTGAKRNNRRGRGGGIQKAKTGRKTFRRTLSRRRRTGAYITSKKVKVG